MSPQLIVFLIKAAIAMPQLAKEIKDLATRSGDVTDAEWEETASVLATDSTASYFPATTAGNPAARPLTARSDAGTAQTLTGPATALYGALLPTDPPDDSLKSGDSVYTVTTPDSRGGNRVQFYVVAAGDHMPVLPANATLVRTIA